MTRLRSLFLPLGFLAVALPYRAMAAPFTGSIIPQSGACVCPGSAPDYGCALEVLQNLINFAVYFGIILSVFWIAYAGFTLMTSAGNPAGLTQAKTRILNAVVGIAVILSSWIIVDFVMKAVFNPDTIFVDGKIGPWNAIFAPEADSYCIDVTVPIALTSGSIELVEGSSGSSPSAQTSSGGGGGGGSCSIATQGACSKAALSTTCFASRSDEASRVCNLESAGGQFNIESGSDKLNGGSGPSYSIGLWQINLTTSSIGGLNCPAAFTRPCQGSALVGPSKPGACNSSIKDQELYRKCVAAAKVPANNHAVACNLYKSRGFQPWSFSSRKCNVPFK